VTSAGLLALASGALAAAGLVELASAQRAARGARGGGGGGGGGRASRGGIRGSGPGRAGARLAIAALRRLGRGVGPAAGPRDLPARLDAAGVRLALADLLAIKAGAALSTGLIALVLAPGLPGRLPVLAVLALPAAAFLVPDLWLRRRIRRRAAAMERELPDVLDLVRVAVGAGLPADRALAEVGRRHPGVLARELRRTTSEIALGLPTDEAYARLARRAPVPGATVLTAALVRAARHGASLGPTLAAQAAEARSQRGREAAEAAARAAPKIQLVVALLLVPSVLLLVAAALVPSLTG